MMPSFQSPRTKLKGRTLLDYQDENKESGNIQEDSINRISPNSIKSNGHNDIKSHNPNISSQSTVGGIPQMKIPFHSPIMPNFAHIPPHIGMIQGFPLANAYFTPHNNNIHPYKIPTNSINYSNNHPPQIQQHIYHNDNHNDGNKHDNHEIVLYQSPTKNDNNNFQDEIKRLKDTLEAEIIDKKKIVVKNKELTNQLGISRKALIDMQTLLKEVKDTTEDMNKKKESKDRELSRLIHENKELHHNILRSEAHAKELQSRVDELLRFAATTKDRDKDAKEDLVGITKKFNKELNALKTELDEKDDIIRNLENKDRKKENIIRSNSRDLVILQEENLKLKNDNQNAISEKNMIVAEQLSLKNQVSTLESHFKKLQTECYELRREKTLVFSEYKVEIDRLRRLVEVKNEHEIYENSLLSIKPQVAKRQNVLEGNSIIPTDSPYSENKVVNKTENKVAKQMQELNVDVPPVVAQRSNVSKAPDVAQVAPNISSKSGLEVVSQTITIDPVTGKKMIKKIVKRPKVNDENGSYPVGVDAIATTKMLVDGMVGKVKKPKVNLLNLIKQSVD